MSTPQFLRVGPTSNHIFNIARINSISKDTVTLSEQDVSLKVYESVPIIDNKGYCIDINFSGAGSVKYFYSSEEMRDKTFEKICERLGTTVITKPE